MGADCHCELLMRVPDMHVKKTCLYETVWRQLLQVNVEVVELLLIEVNFVQQRCCKDLVDQLLARLGSSRN